MLPSESAFEEKVSLLGISSDEQLFVYASAGSFSSARAWWTFRAFGHNRVSVINGGMPAWLSIGGPTESGMDYGRIFNWNYFCMTALLITYFSRSACEC